MWKELLHRIEKKNYYEPFWLSNKMKIYMNTTNKLNGDMGGGTESLHATLTSWLYMNNVLTGEQQEKKTQSTQTIGTVLL